jgi:ribosomal protein S15P/S13E
VWGLFLSIASCFQKIIIKEQTMAKKDNTQQQPVDLNLLTRSIVLVAQKIDQLTEEVRLLRQDLSNNPNKEERS